MKKLVWTVAGVMVLGVGLGTTYWRYDRQQDLKRQKQKNEVATEMSRRALAAKHLSELANKRMQRLRAEWNDAELTGSPRGVARWIAIDGRSLCGVTPDGRYYIAINHFGSTRYDEGFDTSNAERFLAGWKGLRCDIAAPANQAKLLKIRRRLEAVRTNRRWCNMFYNGPQRLDCLLAAEKPDFH